MAERLARWWRTHVGDPLQLGFFGAPDRPDVAGARAPDVAPPPRLAPPDDDRGPVSAESAAVLARLEALGLRGVARVTLRRTRRVMVSVRGDRLTLHRDFAQAPVDVLRAVVRFVMSRRRAERLEAQRVILGYEVVRPPARRRRAPVRPADLPLLARLRAAHEAFNAQHFGGTLRPVRLAISGRMKTRLGQYTPVQDGVAEAEIGIGRRHLRRDAWDDVLHTLLHEMVHQWQDESGLPIDHGLAFRRKAREVGCLPRATRTLHR